MPLSRRVYGCRKQSWLGPSTTSKRGAGSYYWYRGSGCGVVWNFDWCARNTPVSEQLTWGALSSHSCSSASPFWGKGADSGRRQITHLEEWNQLKLDPQGFCSSTWHLPLTLVWQCWSLSTGELLADTWLCFIPSISSPGSHQGDGCHHTLGEDLPHAHFRSSSSTKAIGHTQTM